MGCNVRDKSLRGSRKSRNASKQQQPPPSDPKTHNAIPPDSNHLPIAPSYPVVDAQSIPCDSNSNSIHGAAVSDLGYCTEEQLEDLLLAKLDFVYKEALVKLSSLGYDDDLALRAILRNGHCYGTMDVLSNIVNNAVAYINSPAANSNPADAASSPDNICSFPDVRQLQECALTGMVCLLQELQPHLSRGDAMWCLLISDLHVGRASTVEVPVIHPPSNGGPMMSLADASDISQFGCPMMYGAYRFHGGCNGEREGEVQKQLNLSPSTRSYLKRNAILSAAGMYANSKMSLPAPRLEITSPCLSSMTEEEARVKNSEDVASVLKSMENMSLEEKEHDGGDDRRNVMILNLINQIKDLEEQVKDRKEWAQQKAMQAARKLSNDMMELKLLRMERDENQRLKKGKQTLEDTTMKRLSEMENALRKASGQVDRANAAVRQLEAENAELRAEMEASKLSNAESERMCLEITKREKKYMKKLLAREKQKEKMEEEAAEVRKKIAEIQQRLLDTNKERKDMEAKLRETIKAKEQATILVEEERRAKEAAEERIKRKQEALRQKNEIDLQRQKDDIQRLEEEISRLKSSLICTQSQCVSSYLPCFVSEDGITNPHGANGKAVNGFQKLQELPRKNVSRDRECVMCNKDEASVVFLPCAHQVLCATCNENHERRANTCPCCVVVVEQRIRVYGASS